MQGDPDVLRLLNEQLTSELTAVNQYFLHSKLQASWASPSSRHTLAWSRSRRCAIQARARGRYPVGAVDPGALSCVRGGVSR